MAPPAGEEAEMAQAQIALDTPRSPSRLWTRIVGLGTAFQRRREEKRMVSRLLSQRQAGIDTGARV